MPRLLRVVAALALGITGVVVHTGSAAASCGSLEPRPYADAIANAGVAFVGTVAFTTNRDRTAYFTVDEIWQGPNLAWLTIVQGGPSDPNTITTVDRTWSVGTRYLVLAGKDDRGELRDNACSFTTPYQSSLDALRPADARIRYGTLLGGAVIVLVAGAFVFVVWWARRRRAARSRRLTRVSSPRP